MAALIDAMVPFVTAAGGVALFLGVSSMLIGLMLSAFTGHGERRGRLF